jgi:hypothetical protein
MTVVISYPLKKHNKHSFYKKEFHNFRKRLLQKLSVALYVAIATKSFYIIESISSENDYGDFLPPQEA